MEPVPEIVPAGNQLHLVFVAPRPSQVLPLAPGIEMGVFGKTISQ